jgi:hypothetical protein
VTDQALPALGRLQQLTDLSLSFTGITGGEPLRQLEKLHSLKFLSLPKSVQESPHLRYLQKRLPKTEILTY